MLSINARQKNLIFYKKEEDNSATWQLDDGERGR